MRAYTRAAAPTADGGTTNTKLSGVPRYDRTAVRPCSSINASYSTAVLLVGTDIAGL
eukprot:SAG11_NODE_29234_length_313_cov_0.714953_1_plen_56_part_01